ncbi:MAG: MFS transporter [Chloroflexi bacterium]|nr:MFS transporter [Chloroflexota bacterium]
MSIIERLTQRRVAQRTKSFPGWRIAAVCAAINGIGAGIQFYGFSVFFKPMTEDFGWTRTQTSGAFSLSRLEGGFEGPIAGWLIDRIGPKRILLIGITIMGLGYILLYFVNSLLMFYLVYAGVLSLGYNIGFGNAGNAVVAKWFVKKRGRAFSYMALGAGIGGSIITPVLGFAIGSAGWRLTALFAGFALWLICLPLAASIRNAPEEMGLLPDGEAPQKGAAPAAAAESVAIADADPEISYTVKEALRTSTFWVFVLALSFRSFILSSLVVHQIPYLTDMGISKGVASGILGLMVLISIPGRLLFGWLGDIFSKRHLIVVCSLLQAIGIFIFANAAGLAMVWPFLVIYGFGYGGSISLTPAFRADLFGRQYFATIGGITMPLTTLGTISGPVLAGYIYDVSGSYRLAFYIFVALVLCSAITFLFVRKPKPPARVRAAATA